MPLPRLLRPEQVCDVLDVSEKTLKNWRSQGVGPPFLKINNGAVRYSERDVETWIREQRRGVPA